MFVYHNINPIAFSIFGIPIRWYGICYFLSFILGYFFLIWSANKKKSQHFWTNDKIADLLIFVAFGVILGGRMGYVIFYHPDWLLNNPFEMFRFWDFGRSFHAGLLGVIFTIWLFCKINKQKFWVVADYLVVAAPIGIFLGRIGNFLNGELWGRIAPNNLPWAVIFPHVDLYPRHPSQLYEALLEGLLLFIFLFVLSFNRMNKRQKPGIISAWFLVGYGILRIISEFFREPDIHIGYLHGLAITMGQILSIPMIIFGVYLIYASLSKSIRKNINYG